VGTALQARQQIKEAAANHIKTTTQRHYPSTIPFISPPLGAATVRKNIRLIEAIGNDALAPSAAEVTGRMETQR